MDIVVGVLTGPDGILMCRRTDSSPRFPGCWDFPGGHVEPGEARPEALARELLEEVGVAADPGAHAGRDASGPGDFSFHTTAPDGTELNVTGWIIKSWTGTARNVAPNEHSEVRWVAADKALELELSHPEYGTILLGLGEDKPLQDAELKGHHD